MGGVGLTMMSESLFATVYGYVYTQMGATTETKPNQLYRTRLLRMSVLRGS